MGFPSFTPYTSLLEEATVMPLLYNERNADHVTSASHEYASQSLWSPSVSYSALHLRNRWRAKIPAALHPMQVQGGILERCTQRLNGNFQQQMSITVRRVETR